MFLDYVIDLTVILTNYIPKKHYDLSSMYWHKHSWVETFNCMSLKPQEAIVFMKASGLAIDDTLVYLQISLSHSVWYIIYICWKREGEGSWHMIDVICAFELLAIQTWAADFISKGITIIIIIMFIKHESAWSSWQLGRVGRFQFQWRIISVIRIRRPNKDSPEWLLLPFLMAVHTLRFCSSKHFPHHLYILIPTCLYIILKPQQPISCINNQSEFHV